MLNDSVQYFLVLKTLNLPIYDFSIRKQGQSTEIFDSIRRKFVALTPEEWVRQHLLRYLLEDRAYPATLLAVEMEIGVGKLRKRCDAVLHDRSARPLMIVECKAPEVKITQHVFDQAARYNQTLKVDYLLLSNGLEHYCCRVNEARQSFDFLPGIPHYTEL